MTTLSYRAADNIRRFGENTPILGERVMIDPSAVVIGQVNLGDDVSIWPQCAVRADMHTICIGERSNVQDNAVLHVTHASAFNPRGWPLIIGADVTVGHSAVLHGCTVGNRVLIGMGAIVMDGAVIEDEVMLAAGALVPPGKLLESGWLFAGSPARPKRPITEQERDFLSYSPSNYVRLKNQYLSQA